MPTPQALVDKMIDLAKVNASDCVIDLGSGDGRTVITAAKRGAEPGDFPVEHPAKFELVLNAKTARAIGFNPPQSCLVGVDRQIE